ncbi:hypothetical protein GGX14DRAFT_440429 [Mycena pura]|uniref:Uncharacterized protein n=1 Tax=Mycena pura TaxID=153505 RepID=A0AAD6VM57_9AGAR|nr:hypothetical protein GGX14DRAFT_440429 [Mycena pura]
MATSSSSTTETKTYLLEKYSRAYSAKKENGSSEWQHFTNPILRLILDTKLSPEKAESFRLRIVWTMNGGASSGAAQQDIVLEDLDLLAFSSLNEKADSAPLKGVYRDTTFGLRYLYIPESSENQNVYRRFQVSFSTSAATLQLVDAIRNVCPCKTTEPSPQERRRAAAVPVPSVPRVQPAAPDNVFFTQPMEQPIPRPNPTALVSQLQRMPTMQTLDYAMLAPGSSQALLPSSELDPPFVHYSSPRSIDTLSGPSVYAPSSSDPQPNFPKPSSFPTLPVTSSPPKLASFPESSPPASTADSTLMPPPPPPSNPSAKADSQSLVSALRDATELYDLPHSALARLVGDVVREDGFVRLLENLSSMWAMKALTPA